MTAFERAADGFESVLRGVAAQQWDDPTPCDSWTCRDLAGHVIGGVGWAAALIGGATTLPTPDDATRPDDPVAAWTSTRADLAAVCTPDALARRVRWPFGEQTVETGLEWFSLELMIHTWDLATAISLPVTLDPTAVHDHLARLRPLSSHLRGPGMYGPELTPAADADEQEQLLAFLGRDTRA
ncbi:MAG: TIGR03086 family metal-binding protein [Acidimicrobiales bacterium]